MAAVISFSEPKPIFQLSLLKGITCAIGVPAGINPVNFMSFKIKGKLTGEAYLSVSTIPGKIVNGKSLCIGVINKQEYPFGVDIDQRFIHLGIFKFSHSFPNG
jgi:hypothetical protein